jgi:uncharacterized protein YecE (DUF72 family)
MLRRDPTFFIGTAGWSYKDWEGIVYPVKKGAGFHALVFLAQYIDVVEINSTFYRPPALRMSWSWIKRVDGFPAFLFTVKIHQVFTHQRKGFSQRDIKEFKNGIEPLKAHNRLAAILIQFPWSFARNSTNIAYLIGLFKAFGDFPLALEIRHGSWDDPELYDLLSEHKVSFCNIDQPLIGKSIKPTAICTNPELSYVRLHGRNYKSWFNEKAGRDERYNYLYSKNELEEWITRIKDLGKKSKKVIVITNNHYRGQALANALQIKNMVTQEKLDIPLDLLELYPNLKEIVKQIKSGQLGLFEKEKD